MTFDVHGRVWFMTESTVSARRFVKRPELIQEIEERPILRYRECDVGVNNKALIGHGEYKHHKYMT
jgi:hypothetical protein